MEARSRVQWSVAILLGIGAFCFPVFADELYTFSSDFDLQIPAEQDASKGWMADAIIEIDYHLIISDLDVSINVTHTNVIDLQVFLQGPDDTKICLNMFDVTDLDKFPRDENYKDYMDTIFDDEALIFVKEGEAPFTGQFKPKGGNLLEFFDGLDAYGTWRLQIYDAYHYDTGTLESFAIIITVPEPTTVVLLTLGTGLMTLFRPRRR